MDFRKRENIAIDCVLIGLDHKGIQVLLKRRKLNLFHSEFPVVDDWMLTGDLTFLSKTLEASANTIFAEITGLERLTKIQFRTYSNRLRPHSVEDALWIRSRGLRAKEITIMYYGTLPKAAFVLKNPDFEWFSIKELPQLAFDHQQLLLEVHQDLKARVFTEPIIFDLLPEKFTLNQLQIAFEQVLEIELDNRNFRKKALGKSYLIALNEKRKGTAKKPSKLYLFSKEVYAKVRQKNAIVNI